MADLVPVKQSCGILINESSKSRYNWWHHHNKIKHTKIVLCDSSYSFIFVRITFQVLHLPFTVKPFEVIEIFHLSRAIEYVYVSRWANLQSDRYMRITWEYIYIYIINQITTPCMKVISLADYTSSYWHEPIPEAKCPFMMTSSNGSIFRVTGHLCREFTGPRWIPLTKNTDAEFDVFFDLRLIKRLSKES